jgi:acid phosphatase family membrane protein YuiD
VQVTSGRPASRAAIVAAVSWSIATGFSTNMGSPASITASSGAPWANGGTQM